MAKTGVSPFENKGLGAMTKEERQRLLDEGKIVVIDGMDVIATEPVGTVEYSQRGSDVVKKFEFRGKDVDLIKFKMADAEGIVRTNHDKLIASEVQYLPKWNGKR